MSAAAHGPKRSAPASSALRPAARGVGALLLLGIGAVHLYEYIANYYRVIPVIGPLFAANFGVAVALALAIVAPIERLGRAGHFLLRLLVLAAIGFAATTIVGLAISEASTLFGFHEHGYRATILLSLAFEGAVIVLFAVFLVLDFKRPVGAVADRAARGTRPRPAPQ